MKQLFLNPILSQSPFRIKGQLMISKFDTQPNVIIFDIWVIITDEKSKLGRLFAIYLAASIDPSITNCRSQHPALQCGIAIFFLKLFVFFIMIGMYAWY